MELETRAFLASESHPKVLTKEIMLRKRPLFSKYTTRWKILERKGHRAVSKGLQQSDYGALVDSAQRAVSKGKICYKSESFRDE